MKKTVFTFLLVLLSLSIGAQEDTITFKGYLYNSEYDVYLDINFYKNNILVPHQEIFGEIPGYFGDNRDSRKWLFTSVKLTNSTTAQLAITNDYGSEDLTATLRKDSDGTYTLQQEEGSTLKIARNRKWVKMPKELVFKRKDNRNSHP